MPEARRVGRRIAAGLTAYLILPLLLLAGVEFGCRAMAPSDLTLRGGSAQLLDNRGGVFPHVNRAGYSGRFWQRPVRINSLGHRSPEPRPGTERLLLLGDSVMFGVGLSDDESPGAVLAGMLPDTVSVMNAAVIGYSTGHARAWLEQAGEDLRPDAVLLGYALNDPVPAGEDTVLTVRDIRGRYGWLNGLNAWLRSNSMLFVWLKDRFNVYRIRNGYDVHRSLFEGESWARNSAMLADIRTWCSIRSVPFALVVFPHRDQLIPSVETDDHPQRLLAELGSGEGFPVLDLRPFLTADHYLANDGIHLDAGGVRAAMTAAADLVREELLPVDGPPD